MFDSETVTPSSGMQRPAFLTLGRSSDWPLRQLQLSEFTYRPQAPPSLNRLLYGTAET